MLLYPDTVFLQLISQGPQFMSFDTLTHLSDSGSCSLQLPLLRAKFAMRAGHKTGAPLQPSSS